MIARLGTALLLLQAIISVRTELVVVPAVVTDGGDHHVSGLNKDNFRIYDDGRPQSIVTFYRGEAPLALGLVVDRSQSMRSKGAALLVAVSAILESTRPDDELFAVTFNDRAAFVLPSDQPFTNDARGLEAALTAVRAEGQTALYDGVAEALRQLHAGRAERHAIIVVSDGGDNASERTYADIQALARQSDSVIYAIGLLGTSPADEQEDAGLLKRLCRDSGGMAYFPRTVAEIASVSARVAGDLREQYTLGFVPEAHTDRRAVHKIEVTATSAGSRLRVRTRSGYTETP